MDRLEKKLFKSMKRFLDTKDSNAGQQVLAEFILFYSKEIRAAKSSKLLKSNSKTKAYKDLVIYYENQGYTDEQINCAIYGIQCGYGICDECIVTRNNNN